ncbi:MAG: conjugal transfer protein TraG, partial [Eubacteriales bacterium]|nr:conjugal transfer protein TraG [Eubacteriales bacterium]
MRNINVKKLVLLNLPYVLIGLFATKLGQAWRLAAGINASEKLLHIMDGLSAAFQSLMPSFDPTDLLVGLVCGAAMKLAVYLKGKNAKKFRHGQEYGSARWGTAEDIKPYVDPVFQNNVILT